MTKKEFEGTPMSARAYKWALDFQDFRIEDKFEAHIILQEMMKQLAYEAYEMGVDNGKGEVLSKIVNLNIETERLYWTGIIKEGNDFSKELYNERI
jgi:hypothetical protein